MNPTPIKDNTCAVVVMYHPAVDIRSRIDAIRNQAAYLVLVSNGMSEKQYTEFTKYLTECRNCVFIENERNLGVSAALNQGVAHALENGFYWVLLFDQDSTVDDDFLNALARIVKQTGGALGLIGSNYRDNIKERGRSREKTAEDAFRECKTVITSGTLLSRNVYETVGGFNNDYFIDGVDHEYCMRARQAGMKNYISCRPLMSHSIGNDMQSSGKIRKFISAYDHDASRKYYIGRNVSANIRRFYSREPVWAMRQVINLSVEFLSILTFESDKQQKMKSFISGIADGLVLRFPPGPLET